MAWFKLLSIASAILFAIYSIFIVCRLCFFFRFSKQTRIQHTNVIQQYYSKVHDLCNGLTTLSLNNSHLISFQFWQISPIEHLLARITCDTSCVVRRIVSLLVSSYLPTEKTNSERLQRCVSLIEDNPSAARRFYHEAAKTHLTPSQTCKFYPLYEFTEKL